VSITKRLPGFGQAAGSIEKLIKHHMLLGFMAREETPNQKSISRFIKKLEHLTPLEVLLSISDRLAARGPKVEDENIRRHFAGAEAILKAYFEPPDVYMPLITGAEVMKLTGIPEGPRIGVIMNMLRNAEKRGEIKTKEEAIRLFRQLKNANDTEENK
jgi:poly(A) polymerase